MKKRRLGILAIACLGLMGTTVGGAAGINGTSHYPPLVAISDSGVAEDSGDVAARCEGFQRALRIRHQILRSNPLSGRDPSVGAPLDWVLDQKFDFRRKSMTDTSYATAVYDYTRRYLDHFGAVTIPTLIPNRPLYQSDKKTCIRLYGDGLYSDDQN